VNILCLITQALGESAIAEATGRAPQLRLDARDRQQSLLLYSSPDPIALQPLPEGRYRSLCVMTDGQSEAGGGLPSNAFEADLDLRFGIDLEAKIEAKFLVFLDDNPFTAFKRIATRALMGERVQYRAAARLGSRALRDARHELPTFALRSGEDVMGSIYTEVFDEDGRVLRYGGWMRPPDPIAQAAIVFTDPMTGRPFRICEDAEPPFL
jgi:hypothetical protein